MARPEIPAEERRDVYIMVRLTKDEKEMISLAAKKNMRSPSDYARVVIVEAARQATK